MPQPSPQSNWIAPVGKLSPPTVAKVEKSILGSVCTGNYCLTTETINSWVSIRQWNDRLVVTPLPSLVISRALDSERGKVLLHTR